MLVYSFLAFLCLLLLLNTLLLSVLVISRPRQTRITRTTAPALAGAVVEEVEEDLGQTFPVIRRYKDSGAEAREREQAVAVERLKAEMGELFE